MTGDRHETARRHAQVENGGAPGQRVAGPIDGSGTPADQIQRTGRCQARRKVESGRLAGRIKTGARWVAG